MHSSGEKTRYGRTRQHVNRYVKWAYSEAGNVATRYHKDHPHHVRVVSLQLSNPDLKT